MIGYVKHFNINKTMSLQVIDKKYTKILGEISSLMNKEFDSEPVYRDNGKYIKTKIKSYKDRVNTNFQGNKKIPKKMHYTNVCH